RAGLELLEARLVLAHAALELWDLAVTELGGPLQVGLALGALGLAVRLLEPLLGLADRLDGLLLGLPLGLHPGRALTQLGELAVDRLAACDGRLVLLLLQPLKLDLELLDPALHLVDLS